MPRTATEKKLTSGKYVEYLCDSYGSGRSGADLEHLDEFQEHDRKRTEP